MDSTIQQDKPKIHRGGHGVGIGVEMKMSMGMGVGRGCGVHVRVGGDGRYSQPVPGSEFSGTSGSKAGGIPTSGDPGVRLILPNPHTQAEEHSEHDSGMFILFFMISTFD
jgi:hypothetical protein